MNGKNIWQFKMGIFHISKPCSRFINQSDELCPYNMVKIFFCLMLCCCYLNHLPSTISQIQTKSLHIETFCLPWALINWSQSSEIYSITYIIRLRMGYYHIFLRAQDGDDFCVLHGHKNHTYSVVLSGPRSLLMSEANIIW